MNPYDWISDFLYEPREYKQSTKTEEEIQSLLYDENMTELERLELNMASDNLFQKQSVYNKLTEILGNAQLSEQILPKIIKQIPSDGIEMQLHAGTCLKTALQTCQTQIPDPILVELLTLCGKLLGQWNTEVIDNWSPVFEEVVKRANWPSISDYVEVLVTNLSQNSQPVQGRYAAVSTVAALGKHQSDHIDGRVFKRAVQLSKDYEPKVRLKFAQIAFVPLYRAVKKEVNRNYLFEKIMEMIYDPECDIKVATIRAFVSLIDDIHEPEKRQKATSVLVELCGNISDEQVIITMSELLGLIVVKMGDLILENNALLTAVSNFYKDLPSNPSEQIQANFVMSFPAMVKYFDPKILSVFGIQFVALGQAESSLVRTYWLTVVFDVIKLLSEDEEILPQFKEIIIDFFHEEKEKEVLQVLITKLYDIYCYFFREDELNQKKPLILKPRKKKEKLLNFLVDYKAFFLRVSSTVEWRHQEALLHQMKEICLAGNVADSAEPLSDFMIHLTLKGNHQVRMVTSWAFSEVIVETNSIEKKMEILTKLQTSLCDPKNSRMRLSFLMFAEHALQTFSRTALRYFVLGPVMALHSCKELGIKMRVLELLPLIKLAMPKHEEFFAKKYKQLIKHMDAQKKKDLTVLLLRALNIIQNNKRSKMFCREQESRFFHNQMKEEQILKEELGDSSLEELYHREDKLRKRMPKVRSINFIPIRFQEPQRNLKGFDFRKATPPIQVIHNQDTKLPKLISSSKTLKGNSSTSVKSRYKSYFTKKIASFNSNDRKKSTEYDKVRMPGISNSKTPMSRLGSRKKRSHTLSTKLNKSPFN